MYKYKLQKYKYFELTNGCHKESINKNHEGIMVFHHVTYT